MKDTGGDIQVPKTEVLAAKRGRLDDADVPPRTLFDATTISQRVHALGTQIAQDMPEGDLVVVGVLRGAFVFMADLVRVIPRDIRCEFLTVTSYGDADQSSGEVKIAADIGSPIEGKNVLLVEDIVDTGLTLRYLMDLLSARKPRVLEVCALLSKPSRRRVEVPVRFVGFEVPDRFVVGYGMDAGQRYRNLPDIAVLEE